MVRMTCMLVALVGVMPFGCPTTTDPGTFDNSLRNTLTATAEAVDTDTQQAVSSIRVTNKVTLRAAVTAGNTTGATPQFAWLQTGGLGVNLANANLAEAGFTAPSAETDQVLTFLVTVSTPNGATGRATVQIDLQADPDYYAYDFGDATGSGGAKGPTADAGADRRVLPGDTVTLDASRSSGRGLTYRWRQLSGPTVELTDANTVAAKFIAPAYNADANVLRFEVSVTDEAARTVTDRVAITVRDPTISDDEVIVTTSMGNFTLKLYPEDAPITVANFLQYVDDSFYDGTIFHRVIPDFVIQGGGFTTGLVEKDTRDPIINEANNGIKNTRGTVAMARTSAPNSATSQFFVNLTDNDFLDYTATNAGYAVFGEVTTGMDIVDLIATVQTESRSGFDDVPVTDVIIQSIKRKQVEQERQ